MDAHTLGEQEDGVSGGQEGAHDVHTRPLGIFELSDGSQVNHQ